MLRRRGPDTNGMPLNLYYNRKVLVGYVTAKRNIFYFVILKKLYFGLLSWGNFSGNFCFFAVGRCKGGTQNTESGP